jgi:hypothetical protein
MCAARKHLFAFTWPRELPEERVWLRKFICCYRGQLGIIAVTQ